MFCSVGVSSPSRVLTPEPMDSSISPEKSPDNLKRPREMRMLSPEKSPVVIRKYNHSPDIRRYDSKLRSPDLRMRPLEGISSLPQLKEGGSMEDLETTPKPSPEREINDHAQQQPGDSGGTSGSSSMECSPEVKISLSTPPAANPQQDPRSKESSPERTPSQLTTGTSARTEGGEDEDSSGIESSPPPPPVSQQQLLQQQQPASDIESSFEILSKISEDTISAHSLEVDSLGSHSKAASEDVSSASGFIQTTPTPVAAGNTSTAMARVKGGGVVGTHSKAASDDISAASAISRHRSGLAKVESRSLSGIDRVGMATGPVKVGVSPISPLGRYHEKAMSSSPLSSSPLSSSPLSSSPLLPPQPTDTADPSDTTDPMATEEGVVPREGGVATIISPTLKMASKSDQMTRPSEPSVGEEALFEMLGSGGGEETLPASHAQDTGEHDDKDLESMEVLDKFDKILDGMDEGSVCSQSPDVAIILEEDVNLEEREGQEGEELKGGEQEGEGQEEVEPRIDEQEGVEQEGKTREEPGPNSVPSYVYGEELERPAPTVLVPPGSTPSPAPTVLVPPGSTPSPAPTVLVPPGSKEHSPSPAPTVLVPPGSVEHSPSPGPTALAPPGSVEHSPPPGTTPWVPSGPVEQSTTLAPPGPMEHSPSPQPPMIVTVEVEPGPPTHPGGEEQEPRPPDGDHIDTGGTAVDPSPPHRDLSHDQQETESTSHDQQEVKHDQSQDDNPAAVDLPDDKRSHDQLVKQTSEGSDSILDQNNPTAQQEHDRYVRGHVTRLQWP